MKRALGRVVLVVALVIPLGYAAPAHALAGLRAITCCARDCHHGRLLADAMRCCGVQAGDHVAVTAPVGKNLRPTLAANGVALPVLRGEPLVALVARPTPPRDRPPPVFLLVRSLRL